MSDKILQDHKREGKLFQPPLLALGTFVETGWIDYAIPEFIWIMLLIEEYGINAGSLLALEFSRISDPYIISKTDNGSAASMISYYELLNDSDKKQITKELDKRSIISKLRSVLSPFVGLYPECPLNFLISSAEQKNNEPLEDYLSKYKASLKKMYNKTGFECSIVMANVTNFLLYAERIVVTESSKTPHLKEILNYPNTEDSRHLASFLRSSIPMCFNVTTYNRENTWIKYFWNQGLKIERSLL